MRFIDKASLIFLVQSAFLSLVSCSTSPQEEVRSPEEIKRLDESMPDWAKKELEEGNYRSSIDPASPQFSGW